MSKSVIPYCLTAAYPGLKPVCYGTIVVPSTIQNSPDLQDVLYQLFQEWFYTLFPKHLELPKVLEWNCGSLIFIPED